MVWSGKNGYKQCVKWNGMEVVSRDRYLHGKIIFSYCSPSFHFLIPLFYFLLIFFLSLFFSSSFLHFILSFHFLLLFFLLFGYGNFLREEEDNI